MEKMLPESVRKQVQEVLSTLQQPVGMVVFKGGLVSTPGQGEVGLQDETLAFHNPQVVAEGIEASEFPRLSTQFRISSVPDTIITGERQERVLGGQPDRVFVEAVLKASAVAATAEVR
jgi:hypothetical protein